MGYAQGPSPTELLASGAGHKLMGYSLSITSLDLSLGVEYDPVGDQSVRCHVDEGGHWQRLVNQHWLMFCNQDRPVQSPADQFKGRN